MFCKRTGARAARIVQLETGDTALAYFGAVTHTLCPSGCDAIRARTFVGFALGFVLAHLPARVATRHLASRRVGLGVFHIALCMT